jgi:hypothetical protein
VLVPVSTTRVGSGKLSSPEPAEDRVGFAARFIYRSPTVITTHCAHSLLLPMLKWLREECYRQARRNLEGQMLKTGKQTRLPKCLAEQAFQSWAESCVQKSTTDSREGVHVQPRNDNGISHNCQVKRHSSKPQIVVAVVDQSERVYSNVARGDSLDNASQTQTKVHETPANAEYVNGHIQMCERWAQRLSGSTSPSALLACQ